MILLRCLAAGAFSFVPLAAQSSFTTFGSTCSQGLQLSAVGSPHLGQPFFVGYTGAIGSQFVGPYDILSVPVLLLGLSNTQAGGAPLPAVLPLDWTLDASCVLLVSPDAMVQIPLPATPPFGLTLPIPATPSFVGATFHLQWLQVQIRSTFGQFLWLRLASSNGGTAVVGP